MFPVAVQQCAALDATCPVACARRKALLAGVAGELWRWAAGREQGILTMQYD